MAKRNSGGKKTTKAAKRVAKKETKKGLPMSESQKEKYVEIITNRLNSMEEAHYTKPWVSPHTGWPCNVYSQNKPYRGCNRFFLTMLMEDRGWTTPYFIARRQRLNEDGNLKYKGIMPNSTPVVDEKGYTVLDDKGMPKIDTELQFPVLLTKPIRTGADGKEVKDEDYEAMTDEERKEVHTYWLKKFYLVYNLEQTNFASLYPDDWAKMTEVPEHDYKQGVHDDVLERMIMGEWRCAIKFEGQRSCYHVMGDYISLPQRSQFLGDEMFYSVALHEMAHSTSKELGRDVMNEFGSYGYAIEELVAELTSAILCSMLGIGKLLDDNHIAYVQNWKDALHTDKDVIPVVLDDVRKAVNYFMRKYDEVASGNEVAAIAA